MKLWMDCESANLRSVLETCSYVKFKTSGKFFSIVNGQVIAVENTVLNLWCKGNR
jgi:hypothetical protein